MRNHDSNTDDSDNSNIDANDKLVLHYTNYIDTCVMSRADRKNIEAL